MTKKIFLSFPGMPGGQGHLRCVIAFAMRDSGRSAALPSALALGHVLKYTPVALGLGALHLTHSDASHVRAGRG